VSLKSEAVPELVPPAPEAPAGPKRWAWQDSAIAGGYLLFTILLYNGLWFDLKRGYLLPHQCYSGEDVTRQQT